MTAKGTSKHLFLVSLSNRSPLNEFVGSIGQAVIAPIRAWRGEMGDDQMIEEASNLAGMLTLGGAMAPKAAAPLMNDVSRMYASRSAHLFDPPKMPERSIFDDYRGTIPADENGRLTHDIEGLPISPNARVVGRGMVGGEDVPLSPSEYDAVTQSFIGKSPESWPAGAFRGRQDTGVYRLTPRPEGIEREIGILNTLSPSQAVKITAHEMGHMFEDLSGDFARWDGRVRVNEIPNKGILNKELKPI